MTTMRHRHTRASAEALSSASQSSYTDVIYPQSDVENWRELAACRGTPIDWWFPARGQNSSRKEPIPPEAAETCALCPVVDDCLEHALHHETIGVWAGRSQRELRRIRRAAGIRVNVDTDDTIACERAARLYRAGLPVDDIAGELSRTPRTVYRLLERAGIHTNRCGRERTA